MAKQNTKFNLYIDSTSYTTFICAQSTTDIQICHSKIIKPNQTTEVLIPEISNLLKEFSDTASLMDIVKIFVAVGPGSSTGIRIGITFAKTLMLVNHTLKVVPINLFDECQNQFNRIGFISDRKGMFISYIKQKDSTYSIIKLTQEELLKNEKHIIITHKENEEYNSLNLMKNSKTDIVLDRTSIGKLTPIYGQNL